MSDVDQINLPSGWTLTPVGDLLKFKNGLNKGKAYFGYGTPIVNYLDVFRHAGLRRADVYGLVDVTNAEKQAFSARKGDILFTRTSETSEEVGISTVLLEDIEDAVFSGFVLRGRPLNDRLTLEFAQYCFESRFVRGQIVSSATYTTRALTNGRILSGVKLPVPDDPKEQLAIAAALSDADGVVGGLELVIAKKRLIKQGAMQDLLTARRRLPGFSAEWEDIPLGGIGPFVGGGTPSMARPDYWQDGTIPWVSSSDIRIGILNGAERLISAAAVRGSSTRVVDPGAILFVTRSGILRRFQPVMMNTVPVAINQDIKALLPRSSDYLPIYVFHAAVASGDQIIRDCMKTGTTVESIDLGALRRFTIRCPKDIQEQQAIAGVLSEMDAEIRTLEFHLAKARAVKEGMMQNLLTGRARLV
jgi:type I restriction enzyme S subunit